MNVPHTAVFDEYLTGTPSQIRKSWYMLSFQLPRLSEWIYSAADWRGLRWFIDTSNRADTFTEADLDRYREAWLQPGAFTAMLNWYRVLFRGDVEDPPTSTVDAPTLFIRGDRTRISTEG